MVDTLTIAMSGNYNSELLGMLSSVGRSSRPYRAKVKASWLLVQIQSVTWVVLEHDVDEELTGRVARDG